MDDRTVLNRGINNMRKLIVKYDGQCTKCNTDLEVGTEAMYEKTTGIFCVGCEPTDPEAVREYRQAKLDRKSDRRQAWAASAVKQADSIDKSLTPYKDYTFITQPILVGHHSEKGHRNLLKRIHGRMDKEYELRKKAENHLQHVGAKAVVKGDAERRYQAVRDKNDAALTVGSKVYDACFGEGVIKKVNKKTYTITWDKSGNTWTRDKSFVRPVDVYAPLFTAM